VKLTIRARFGLMCGVVFLIAGEILLGVLTLMVYRTLDPRPSTRHPSSANIPPYDGYLAGGWGEHVRGVFQSAERGMMLLWGSLVVVGMSVVAGLLGWLLSDRVLRPLRGLAEQAKVAAVSLEQRSTVGYEGPRDQVGQLAEVFDLMLARSSRAFEGQRRFVANASHELRTPLAINRTLVDVAVRRPDASDDLKRLGESLLVVNTRHEQLIEGLLTLADSEQPVVDRRPFDLMDVVEHVLDQTGPEVDKRKVTVHRLLQSTPTVGDPVLVERLVQNLVENGLRHNHLDGELWIITKTRADGVAELVVANTGPVVPEYEVATIFAPFRRLHGDRLRSERGSGLGLSIVRAIADAHGGTVTATPREEGGLTMSVELPGEA
jgi:signal transduction histidine kinase